MSLKNWLTGGLAALVLGSFGCDGSAKADYHSQEEKIETKASEELVKKLKSFANYEHFDHYDSLIIQEVDFWNQEYKKFSSLPGYSPLEYNLVKSMMIKESGSPKHKETAFKYDPMQMANAGDPAFPVLKKGGESGIPLKGYAELRNKKPTPWKNKRLNYAALNDEERITAELSIKYGIRWLWQKAVKYDAQGKIYAFRPWPEAVKRYNASSTKEKYAAEIFDRVK